MSGQSQDDFFGGASHPALKFETMGQGYKGTILDEPRGVQRPSLNGGELEWQMPINLDVDGEPRTLWVRANTGLSTAIREARVASGAKALAVGGTLAVAWVDTKPAKVQGHSPAKVYQVAYKPPAEQAPEAVAAAAADIFDL